MLILRFLAINSVYSSFLDFIRFINVYMLTFLFLSVTYIPLIMELNMVENENQVDGFDYNEDEELAKALKEYADSMDDLDRKNFLDKISEDKKFYFSMAKSLSEMAMLIAGAAVINDEDEFGKMRKRILFEARKDDSSVKTLRMYYLNNRDAVEMDAVLSGDDDRVRYESRLKSFLDDYRLNHPDAS